MQWAALVRLLGEPAESGHHPVASEQWERASAVRSGVSYAVWDCNGYLNDVKEAGRVLDRLEAEYDFEGTATLRGFNAQFLAVSCCFANRRDADESSWTMINPCAKHRLDMHQD
jgi:hypothetical protein